MKVALILPGSIWYAPYVRIYTRILDSINADYDIISWNREGNDKPEGFQYNVISVNGHNSAGLSAYLGYIKYIIRIIKKEKFDKIIVFGPQMTCLLSCFLLRHYRGKYIIDYRDLSIEQKFGFRQLFAQMLNYSFANVISSPGFLAKLPKRKDYLLSHNFDVKAVNDALFAQEACPEQESKDIDVLTIGAIRDYSSNIEIVKSLANQKNVKLRFVGRGDAAIQISEYCRQNEINNISFTGFYQKEEEETYVKQSTFLNIFYPRIVTHDTALSNRFYLSLIYKKPMIVTKDTTQGDFAEKYNVGIAIETCENLHRKLDDFLIQDWKAYCIRCNELLQRFLDENKNFENMVRCFVSSS